MADIGGFRYGHEPMEREDAFLPRIPQGSTPGASDRLAFRRSQPDRLALLETIKRNRRRLRASDDYGLLEQHEEEQRTYRPRPAPSRATPRSRALALEPLPPRVRPLAPNADGAVLEDEGFAALVDDVDQHVVSPSGCSLSYSGGEEARWVSHALEQLPAAQGHCRHCQAELDTETSLHRKGTFCSMVCFGAFALEAMEFHQACRPFLAPMSDLGLFLEKATGVGRNGKPTTILQPGFRFHHHCTVTIRISVFSEISGGVDEPKNAEQHGVREEDLPTLLAVHVAEGKLREGVTSLDFSRNKLTESGLDCLLKMCSFKSLLVVKLYRNALTDAAAPALAALCHSCPQLSEMHLSHNSFTSIGTQAIVDAALSAEKLQELPLWLRLERNRVEQPQRLLDSWGRRSVCRVTEHCRRQSCSLGKRVHVPHFTNQEATPESMQPWHRVDPATSWDLPPGCWDSQRCSWSTSGYAPCASQARCTKREKPAFSAPRDSLLAKNDVARWLTPGAAEPWEMDEGLKHRVMDIAAAWERVQVQGAPEAKSDSDTQSTEAEEAKVSPRNTLAWLRMDGTTRAQIINMVEEPEIDFDSEESDWDEPAESNLEGTELEAEEPSEEALVDESAVAAAMDAQEPRIVYTGTGFFLLFKPPKCVCDPHNTSIGVGRFVNQLGIDDTDAAICHRLDSPTSGLLLVGNEPATLEDLLRQRNQRRWCKDYVCLMHGWLPPRQVEGTVKFKLRTEREGYGYRTFVDEDWGLPAITHYAALRHYKCKQSARPFTLMMLRIVTGRTHQIRVHINKLGVMAGLKTPGIAGDAKYLDSMAFAADVALFQRASRAMAKDVEPRLCLHACSLGFRVRLPSRSHITVKCGLPRDMASVIRHELIEEPRSNAAGPLAESGSWIIRRGLDHQAWSKGLRSRCALDQGLLLTAGLGRRLPQERGTHLCPTGWGVARCLWRFGQISRRRSRDD
ncbi:unnamed protein product [Effrenium voratum]|uniref:Pseudouridine synthase RsuA/RluA-like domain-containing protein n=1 Tax=Effrenium voratum TaxID=2562239 RepID=A0AA36NBR3_9DINO|nr:unnamed protein product [Effrenium voratum]